MRGWTVIVPMRALDSAKSRLRPATSSPEEHRDLVLAMRRDSVAAVVAARRTARVVIVTERVGETESCLATAVVSAPVVVITDPPGSGLNQAIRHGAEWAATQWPEDWVAAVVADLPALTSEAFDQVLEAAEDYPRGFVVDRHESGTTMITARPGVALDPLFGTFSAGRHAASGAVTLPAAASVRSDVDLPADLDVVCRIGVGPATSRALALTCAGAPPTG